MCIRDSAGGGGQHVLRIDAQLLTYQLAAFFGQSHACLLYTSFLLAEIFNHTFGGKSIPAFYLAKTAK